MAGAAPNEKLEMGFDTSVGLTAGFPNVNVPPLVGVETGLGAWNKGLDSARGNIGLGASVNGVVELCPEENVGPGFGVSTRGVEAASGVDDTGGLLNVNWGAAGETKLKLAAADDTAGFAEPANSEDSSAGFEGLPNASVGLGPLNSELCSVGFVRPVISEPGEDAAGPANKEPPAGLDAPANRDEPSEDLGSSFPPNMAEVSAGFPNREDPVEAVSVVPRVNKVGF